MNRFFYRAGLVAMGRRAAVPIARPNLAASLPTSLMRFTGARCLSSVAAGVVEEEKMGLNRYVGKPFVPYFLPYANRRPEKVARYEIGREIGRGNFASVHEALDHETGEMVAVKMMDKRSTPRELCKQELRILRELESEVGHSRLTPIKDVYETEEKLCFVLELIRGGDFYEHVSKNGRLKEPDAARVIRKLIYALEALHRHGIIHRDIKLENILLSSSRKDMDSKFNAFKITDFGYAKHVTEEDKFTNYAGTLGYTAPEVLEFRQYTTACDVWSAGIVLYILLAGYPPFPYKEELDPSTTAIDDLVAAEIEAIHYGRQRDVWNQQFLEEPWNTISTDAKRLVSGMLRIDPTERFTTTRVLNDPWIQKATHSYQQEYLNFE